MSTVSTVTPSLPATPDDSIQSRKGVIVKCHACKNADLPLPKRVSCKFCLTNGYVAKCLPCHGSGTTVSVAAWDGVSKHGSTCNSCGGLGTIPARESEFRAQNRELA